MAEQTAKQRVQEKLRTFYEGLPEEERRIVAALVMPTDTDVRGYEASEREFGPSITVPTFDAVIATRLLEVPAFERVASNPEAVIDSVQPETSSTTVQFERQ
jgi:hypothetical protein